MSEDPTHFDLVIIGSGSGNTLVTPDFDLLRTAVVDRGVGSEDAFGGTCLNVGCIPTKMFVHTADIAAAIADAGRFGLDATLDGVRWRDIRDRVFGRIDPISESGRDYRRDAGHTEAYLGHARFVDDRELEVEITLPGGRHEVGSTHRIRGDQVVIATGSRPYLPTQVRSSGVPFHTSDSIMRIDELPASLVILGGGVVASELAHVFASFGVRVSVVVRGRGLLTDFDKDLSAAFTDLARAQWDVRTGAQVETVREGGEGVELQLADGGVVTGEMLLVATGRVPNTEDLGLEHTTIRTHRDGRVVVDEHGRTGATGVWALGDVSSPYQLKHVANQEARVVAHNLVHPDDLQSFDHRYVPAAVFSHPQVATVGLTSDEAQGQGYVVTTKTQRYGDVAYGWAMEDSTGLFTVVADRTTGRILGAHIMGPYASTLIQPVIQALSLAGPEGAPTALELARGQYWIHPALTEVLENALLGLDAEPEHDVTADYDPSGQDASAT